MDDSKFNPIFPTLCLICAVGIVGHTLTLFMLRKLKTTIKKSLDSPTQRLLVSLACCDVLLNAVGAPLRIWNIASGSVWPFTVGFICYYPVWALFNCISTSLMHATVIAGLRFVAVFLPTTYSQVQSLTGWRQHLLILFPWLLGNIWFVVGYFASWYRCYESASLGNICDVMPVSSDPTDIAFFKKYTAFRGLWDPVLPLLIGCVLYVCVLAKLHRQNKRFSAKRHQQAPRQMTTSAVAAGETSTVSPTGGTTTARGGASAAATSGGNERRNNAVKVVALACFANLALMFPIVLAVMVGFYPARAVNYPIIKFIFEAMYACTNCATPIMYAAASNDMRAIYKDLLLKPFRWMKPAKKSSSKVHPIT